MPLARLAVRLNEQMPLSVPGAGYPAALSYGSLLAGARAGVVAASPSVRKRRFVSLLRELLRRRNLPEGAIAALRRAMAMWPDEIDLAG
jgi:hypothetical protein